MDAFEKKERELADSIGCKIEIKKSRIGNLVINYAEAGEGPPLILIHGANIGWGFWHANINELSKYFKIYAPDMPGSGGSTKISFEKLNFDQDIVHTLGLFIDSLKLNQYSLAGHSLGAWTALKLALQRGPEIKKLILASPMGFSRHVPSRYRLISLPWAAKLISKTVMRPNLDNMASFLSDALYGQPKVEDGFANYFYESVIRERLTHPLMLINRLSNFLRVKEQFVLINNLSEIHNPALIIAGDRDPIVSLDRSLPGFLLMPNKRIEIFSDTGHVPSLEKSREFNDLVIRFLKS